MKASTKQRYRDIEDEPLYTPNALKQVIIELGLLNCTTQLELMVGSVYDDLERGYYDQTTYANDLMILVSDIAGIIEEASE